MASAPAGGSPPRVRGKRVAPPQHRPQPRLTPACAGKTQGAVGAEGQGEAHPRVCGENSINLLTQARNHGSPPRVRGKRYSSRLLRLGRWLTPACAGKTPATSSQNQRAWAHPRVCGENLTDVGAWTRVEGSPPRVRGKRPPAHTPREPGGLTPACAGKTATTARVTPSRAAHPRVCGENRPAWPGAPTRTGSPPRVRGKQVTGNKSPETMRLTPACAGKTSGDNEMTRRIAAHPRVCGENEPTDWPVDSTSGSPPRVRGKRDSAQRRGGPRGLTPACAGKTARGSRARSGGAAHPRVCGENTS